MTSYIAPNQKELFAEAPSEIKALITGGENKTVAATVGKIHNIPAGMMTRLSNIISLVLIGAIQPENVVQALQEILSLSKEDAEKVAHDLETSIFEKARLALQVKSGSEVKVLEFKGERSPDELRKEILDTTKRESAITKPPVVPSPQKKTSVITPGSRSQLLEQLQVIGSIPDDEEIEERLKHIQEQISKIKKEEEDNTLDSNIALKSFMFGEKGKTVATPKAQPSTYSTAPTEYNIDPYREMAED